MKLYLLCGYYPSYEDMPPVKIIGIFESYEEAKKSDVNTNVLQSFMERSDEHIKTSIEEISDEKENSYKFINSRSNIFFFW